MLIDIGLFILVVNVIFANILKNHQNTLLKQDTKTKYKDMLQFQAYNEVETLLNRLGSIFRIQCNYAKQCIFVSNCADAWGP